MDDDLKEKIAGLEKEFKDLEEKINFREKKKELAALEKKMSQPDFWKNQKEAAAKSGRANELREEVKNFEEMEKEIREIKTLAELAVDDEAGIRKIIDSLSEKLKKSGRQFFLSGQYDKNPAILTVGAGAGGRDAEDWTAMLLRMYQRWAERKNFPIKIIRQNFGEGGGPEGRIGLKEAAVLIKGKFAYGMLKKESGVHRLVRLSPFSAKGLRHTSFAKVEVLPKMGEGETEIKLKQEELKIETFRSSGKGGQNVNKRETAVRLIHLPTGLRAECQVERLQARNREMAEEILLARLAALREKEKEAELKKIKGEKISADFGSQIRSYVLHPYKMAKDLRTGVETNEVEGVLDGEIDGFIDAEIKLT